MAVASVYILEGKMNVHCVKAVKYVVMEGSKNHAKNVSDHQSVSTKHGDIIAKNVPEKGFVNTKNIKYIVKNVWEI